MAKTIAEAVKQYNNKNKKKETKQISIFDLFGVEEIIIKVEKKDEPKRKYD